jgi:hypothetical protein
VPSPFHAVKSSNKTSIASQQLRGGGGGESLDRSSEQYIHLTRIRGSVVGIATGYGLEDRGVGVRVPIGSRNLSLYRWDRLWNPSNLLSNGETAALSRGYSGWGVKLTTHLQLVRRSRIRGSIHPLFHTSSWRSAWWNTGTTLPLRSSN